MDSLTYTIQGFDQTNNVAHVVFDDNSYADILLPYPVPTQRADLDAVIKRFAPTVETVAARTSAVVAPDYTLINSLIGTPVTTDRLTAAMTRPPASTSAPTVSSNVAITPIAVPPSASDQLTLQNMVKAEVALQLGKPVA